MESLPVEHVVRYPLKMRQSPLYQQTPVSLLMGITELSYHIDEVMVQLSEGFRRSPNSSQWLKREGSQMRKKTNEQFASELAQALPSVSMVGQYTNARTKVAVRCNSCGYDWAANPFDLLNQHGCPRCAGKERKTPKRFREEVAAINPSLEIIGEYVNTSTKIETRCRKCGYSWMANPSTLRKGIGCPACGGTLKKSHEEFARKLHEVNPDIEILGKYKNNRTKLLVRCLTCGHEWSQTPHNLLDARSRCPRCTHSSTSFMEQYIAEFLRQALGDDQVFLRDTNAIGMELDLYVPALKLAFEPGAWFWHKQKLDNDAEKRVRCNSCGIRLITVYDKVPNNERPKGKDIYCFPYDLRIHKDRSEIQALLLRIMAESGVENVESDIDWATIESVGYRNSVKTDTEEFREKLTRRGIDVEVAGTYKSSSSRILVRCKTCGHEWSPRADTLLAGNSSCKKCGTKASAKKHLKTHAEFVKEAAERNPTVEVVGKYKRAASRIAVRCKLCGYEWAPVANTIVRKNPSACPECGKRKMIATRQANAAKKRETQHE